MGNSQSGSSDNGIVYVRSETPLRDGSGREVTADEDDEVMVALSSAPTIIPLLNRSLPLEEIDSFFDIPVVDAKPLDLPGFDSFTVMRIQTAWQSHVQHSSRKAADKQSKLQDKLFECDRRAAKTLRSMQEHTLRITNFTGLLPEISTLTTDLRNTRLRIELIAEAAHRLDKAMKVIEKKHF